jgi:putative transposase
MIDDDGRVRKIRKTYNLVGHAHELTFSCFRRLPLLTKDRTRQWFVNALDRARTLHDFAICAYVIMPVHAHVLIFPRKETHDVSDILKSVKQSVGRRAIAYLRDHSPDWLRRLEVSWPDGTRREHRF